jgi:very-short-patch-repair endonuclease
MPFKDRMKPAKLAKARKMFEKPTPSEAALWERLKGRQLGVAFVCQERVLGHIAAFYCAAAKLVVEVDGPSHDTDRQRRTDAVKDRAVKWRDLIVLRLPTTMTTEEMVERIDRKLHFLQVERDQSVGERPDKEAA